MNSFRDCRARFQQKRNSRMMKLTCEIEGGNSLFIITDGPCVSILVCRMQYIEQEMTKKKGAKKEEENISSYEAKMKALYQLPDHLQTQSKSKTEEMLSNQMLSGIPEVDLGLE